MWFFVCSCRHSLVSCFLQVTFDWRINRSRSVIYVACLMFWACLLFLLGRRMRIVSTATGYGLILPFIRWFNWRGSFRSVSSLCLLLYSPLQLVHTWPFNETPWLSIQLAWDPSFHLTTSCLLSPLHGLLSVIDLAVGRCLPIPGLPPLR